MGEGFPFLEEQLKVTLAPTTALPCSWQVGAAGGTVGTDVSPEGHRGEVQGSRGDWQSLTQDGEVDDAKALVQADVVIHHVDGAHVLTRVLLPGGVDQHRDVVLDNGVQEPYAGLQICLLHLHHPAQV